MAKKDLLTAKKVAEALGVSAGAVSKAIKEHGIQPDEVKGACKYYGPKTVQAIKKALK